jgi:hypothetical protein
MRTWSSWARGAGPSASRRCRNWRSNSSGLTSEGYDGKRTPDQRMISPDAIARATRMAMATRTRVTFRQFGSLGG